MAFLPLDIAATGMNAQEQNVANIANNISNSNTDGFKRGDVNFTDLMYLNIKRAGTAVTGQNTTQVTPSGVQLGLGVNVANIAKDFQQGALEQTGTPLNFALQGKGMFIVRMPDGTEAYTRKGNFSKDTNGRIVTQDGYAFNSEDIVIPIDTTDLTVSLDGTVQVKVPTQDTLQTIGNIQLAKFINESGLEAIGGDLYLKTDASGDPVYEVPGNEGTAVVKQAFIENSNVDAIKEMINLIKAQRNYEMNSKVIQATDQMLRNITDAKA